MISNQYLRMGVLNAVLSLQDFRVTNPNIPLAECARRLAGGLANRSGFDYNAALELAQILPDCCDPSNNSRRTRLLNVIEQMIRVDGHLNWAILIPKGRRYVETYLRDSNALHCLECAGLYERPLQAEGAAWWLRLGNYARSLDEAKRAEIGRQGEQLTIRSEQLRLAAAGYQNLLPEWISIEDNTLGYDVKSFDIIMEKPADLFIEVKASSGRPLRFFVSRGEWRAAEQMQAQFLFHIWDLSTQSLLVMTPEELSNHLPTDQGEGTWKSVEITL